MREAAEVFGTVFGLIDTRSFSNVWYWLTLGAVWAVAGFRVLGVPMDLISQAVRQGGVAGADLDAVADVAVRRRLAFGDRAGVWLVGLAAMAGTGLGLLGFGYGIEIAQATFLLAAPLALVWWLGLRTARAIAAQGLAGPALARRLLRHRAMVQAIGIGAVFLAAVWGMYRNLSAGLFP